MVQYATASLLHLLTHIFCPWTIFHWTRTCFVALAKNGRRPNNTEKSMTMIRATLRRCHILCSEIFLRKEVVSSERDRLLWGWVSSLLYTMTYLSSAAGWTIPPFVRFRIWEWKIRSLNFIVSYTITSERVFPYRSQDDWLCHSIPDWVKQAQVRKKDIINTVFRCMCSLFFIWCVQWCN